jgi:DNA-directed RNA polymerase specialized sigma24 family protein
MEASNYKYMLNVPQIQKRGAVDVKLNSKLPTSGDIPSSDLRQHSAAFEARFARCHGMLCFLACRVLGSPEQVRDVVKNCWITASRNPPTFEYEGAFRSWLVRILIDEALAIVRQRKSDVTNTGTTELAEVRPNGFNLRRNRESHHFQQQPDDEIGKTGFVSTSSPYLE